MVPMSVRAEAERGALGNRVTSMFAPLPVYADDPVERFQIVHEAMKGLKESGQAVGAELLTQLAGFAPPTVLSQASRLQSSQRVFNVVVTNVPGPQFPLYMLGRRLLRIYPQVPLVTQHGAGDRDHVLRRDAQLRAARATTTRCPTSTTSPAALRDAIAELAAAAGVPRAKPRARPAAARSRAECGLLGWLLVVVVALAAVVGGVLSCSRATTPRSAAGGGPGERVEPAARRAGRPSRATRGR